MNNAFSPYDLCPCDSGLKAKFCCLDGNSWNKKPIKLVGENPITGYTHKGCYANKTNDCSTKISKEHLISNYILDNLGNAKVVKIKGPPYGKPEEVKIMPKAGLVANVLCVRHNSLLSPFDTEMGKFHKTFNKYEKELNIEKPVNDISIFCGENLEKWMLKTACSYIASKQIYSGDKKIECDMKDIYVDILYNDQPFPEGWGLYIDAAEGTIQTHNYIAPSFIIRGTTLMVVKMIINSLVFYLTLDNPQTIRKGLIYRPRGIEIKKGNVKKVIEICWQDKKYNQGVFLTHTRNISRTPEEWDEWVFNKDH
ncbi:hypothetical protein IM793_05565 [Pedobacter sp. MR2016-19]|uniref:hypothetical protein n=1 Tax=Pedobacter sp. MR2016-19 TaxID=2780089 RepID=UPI0010433002|nr:hypothetical protein [Pedobacter sp. MR2016-19]MBE5318613.1 hypothetical protein [Pedobacter sp. MR2016-19]